MKSSSPYRGRFAPSPSGPLHFGSLVSALCSFLQARSKQGQWLIRIEDIDPPREVVGASDLILKALDIYGLHWDEEVLYQSNRLDLYQHHLEQLNKAGKTFNCDCTRAKIKQSGGIYSGLCTDRNLAHSTNTSIRFKSDIEINAFNDQLLGKKDFSAHNFEKNFVLKRKDGLFAYQLAVVIDDWQQRISEVVRGTDLLDSTPKQLQLFNSFQASPPEFFHHPLVVDCRALKLSKQNKADAINLENPLPTLIKALQVLGQKIPKHHDDANLESLIQYAIKHWNPEAIPHQDVQFSNF